MFNEVKETWIMDCKQTVVHSIIYNIIYITYIICITCYTIDV